MATATISKPPKKVVVSRDHTLVAGGIITDGGMLTLGQRRYPPTMRALRRACGKAPFLVRAF